MKNKKIRISLCNKIILIIVVALFVCTCLWTSVMFFNISNNAREVALTDEKNNMYNVSAQLKDVEETCYLVRQLVLQKNRIFEYIQKVQNNQDYKGVKKLDFYKNEMQPLKRKYARFLRSKNENPRRFNKCWAEYQAKTGRRLA